MRIPTKYNNTVMYKKKLHPENILFQMMYSLKLREKLPLKMIFINFFCLNINSFHNPKFYLK